VGELSERLVRLGLDAGLDRCGIADAAPFPEVATTISQRKSAGLHAGLTFTYNHPDRSTDIRASFPWARRLVVGGRAYAPESGTPGPGDGSTARIARFAVEDFYAPLRRALDVVAAALSDAGYRAEVVSDDNRLVDRAAAVRAGVGWWGKNTMVLAPEVGPWMLLGSVVTDAGLAVDEPMTRDCGTCDACLPACPTGALVAPGVLDARRCIAALAQLPGPIPEELRVAMGDRVYGCDDCLDACPPGARRARSATSVRGRVEIEHLLTADDETLLAEYDRFYLPRRNPSVLRRNALVAAGNSGSARLRPTVERYVDDPDALLAEHARWALDRLVP
jgi:epoxyqueuosine reductase